MKPSSMRTVGPLKSAAARRTASLSLPAHQISRPLVAAAWAAARDGDMK